MGVHKCLMSNVSMWCMFILVTSGDTQTFLQLFAYANIHHILADIINLKVLPNANLSMKSKCLIFKSFVTEQCNHNTLGPTF